MKTKEDMLIKLEKKLHMHLLKAKVMKCLGVENESHCPYQQNCQQYFDNIVQ